MTENILLLEDDRDDGWDEVLGDLELQDRCRNASVKTRCTCEFKIRRPKNL